MAQVINTNLFSEPRNNVVNLISNKSNVSDPTTSASEFRKWIYSSFPDVKNSSFKGYPILVVKSTDLNTEDENASANMKSKLVNFDTEIEIYTSDRGYGDNNGKGLFYMEAISNNIGTTFQDVTNRKTLKANGLPFCEIEATEISIQNVADEKLYKRIISISFRNKMQVSA
jgi:hypothetical protein